MIALPERVPLQLPDERPHAVADLALSVAGAAESLALVGDGLAGTSGATPHWVGADARTAAGQVGVVQKLTGDCSLAVLSVAGRLSVHADLLVTVLAAVARLRAEQDDDFAATWRRVSELPDWGADVAVEPPEAQALLQALRLAEEGRRRRHAALLEELAVDAAATARVLGQAASVVGGRGAPGDGDRVLGRLAPALPGWGDPELAARGRALARALLDAAPADFPSLVGTAAPYAADAAFAEGLLLALGTGGLRELLGRVGGTELSLGRGVAALLGRALGSARPTGSDYDPIGELLTAAYVDPVAAGTADDRVVLGMGAVLAATRSDEGPPLGTVAAWGSQMLARERAQSRGLQGTRALDRERTGADSMPHDDAVALVVERLADADDPVFATRLLLESNAWDVLLARPWNDGGQGLAKLIGAAGAEVGPMGDLAVRTGLQRLAAGLADNGDPDGWTVDPATARAITPALGDAVVAHLTVASDALLDGVAARPATSSKDVLRGLGYLTLDDSLAARLQRALVRWAAVQPVAIHPAPPSVALPSIAVPAAFVAVREYGQRLAYTLHTYDLKKEAESRAALWNWTVGLIAGLLPGPAAAPVGLVAWYASSRLGFDGTWDNGSDHGVRFDQPDALSAARAALGPDRSHAVDALTLQAASAYARTASVLGHPKAARSPATDGWTPLLDAFVGGHGDLGEIPGRAVAH